MSAKVALDEKVRERIFSEMTYPERLRARLVCNQWNDEICATFSFKVILNDESSEFERILKLPIYSLRIDSLKMANWNLRRLRFPTMLAVLVISGPISLTNFEAFLDGQHRLQNLRRLVIYTDQIELIPSSPAGSEMDQLRIKNVSSNFGFGIPFPIIESLTLRSPIPSGGCPFNETIPHRIFDLLLLSRFNNLREFELINWDQPSEEKGYEQKCVLRLFRFLSRHSTTLRSVSIRVSKNPDRTTWPKAHEVKPEMTVHPATLKFPKNDMQVKRLFLSPPPTSAAEREWAAILLKQKRLKCLNCSFRGCLLSFYKPILIRNCHSLKELVLSNISCCDPSSFQMTDLAPFHFCTVLEVLSISRYSGDTGGNGEPARSDPHPDMTNTRNLPSSLKMLQISGFQLLSDQIYMIVGVLTNLVRLELEDVGCSGHFGVTGRCLKELLTNLSELSYVRIRGLNTQGDVEEAVEVIRTIEKCFVTRSLSISAVQSRPSKHTLEWEFNSSFPNPYPPGRTIR